MQMKPVASARADRLDAAAELIVAALGLVVGLGPSMPHPTPSREVMLSAWASVVPLPHMSADVAATRSGACPDLLTVKTVKEVSLYTKLEQLMYSRLQAPGKGPKAVRVGNGVDRTADQKRFTVREGIRAHVELQIFPGAAEGAWGPLVVALPHAPPDCGFQRLSKIWILHRKHDGHQLGRSVSCIVWE